jgi:hypothetical protein
VALAIPDKLISLDQSKRSHLGWFLLIQLF